MGSIKYQKFYLRLDCENNNNINNIDLRKKLKEDTGKDLILDNYS